MTVVLAIMIGVLLLLGHGSLERWMPAAIMLIVSWPSAVVGAPPQPESPDSRGPNQLGVTRW